MRDLWLRALLWGDVKVAGSNLAAEGIGSEALNQARLTATINASYKVARLPPLSADIPSCTLARIRPASMMWREVRRGGDSFGSSIPIHPVGSCDESAHAGAESDECLFLESGLQQPYILAIPATRFFCLSDDRLLTLWYTSMMRRIAGPMQ